MVELQSLKFMSRISSWAAFVLMCLLVLASSANAQMQQQEDIQPTTDPNEVRALNAIFGKWNIKANTEQWNTTGDPCSGSAIDDAADFGAPQLNPFIKCDCSFSNKSLCHITQLKVYGMDVSGPIPDEIWNLTFLLNLDLRQNFLTGPLSPSIGSLTRMQYMSVGINALSGEVPKELGLLTEMLGLAFSSNNFSGPLPSELGKLSKLQNLFIDSAGVSGEIPQSFANLRNLQTLWASDNELTGRIPTFIGNWSQLINLRFQGNAFEGPIPSTFSNLTSLEELRLSDISNMTTSSLDFIKNMKSLTILELRNNNLSASIPASIGNIQSLQHLDLSFNRLHGQIPDSLFNLTSLSSLFLGNNNLNGTIPQRKSSFLRTIDLSYNNLIGDIPSWANTTKLQINLVNNNFTLGSSVNQGIFSRLNCLQKNFPCNRGTPKYAKFGVNSGGPQITSFENITYEADNEALGAASHSVYSSERWGISNAGIFAGNSIANYTDSTSSNSANSLDPELFHTTRLSASSLRYYGLGLENGNYTVSLHFAEIGLPNGRTWKSVGRRVFDVYVQGRLVLKDFDIRKEAGGSSFRAVLKAFKRVVVSENYLEVHLFWAGKGTCCIPASGTYGPSISAFSAAPEFIPTVSNQPSNVSTEENKTGWIFGIVVGLVVLVFGGLFAIFFIVRRRRRRAQTVAQMSYDEEFLGMDVKPFTFSYSELRLATNDFDSANKLGEGGFGPVYKGTLGDGRVIAAKQLSLTSNQGKSQFIAEIAIITAVQHRNLVKLYGCCLEGDKRILVYEFLENNSLNQALFGTHKLRLDWPTRFEICLGVARGLTYLHEESRVRIVHRDVKSSNILLDSNLNPKISDFGLAKLYDDKMTHMSTRIAGTIGYLAPEYAMRGYLTEKTDIYAFGVVALEIISGRANHDSTLDEERMYLLDWTWNLREQGHELEVVDSELSEFDEDEVRRIIGVALLCTQTAPNPRPSMSRVVKMISGDVDISTDIPRPGYLTDWKYRDATSFMNDIVAEDAPDPPPGETGLPLLRDSIAEGM